jgi:hypothetical protein
MTFQHPDVEQAYKRVMDLHVAGLTDEEQPIFALMDAYGWFRLIDGEQTAKVQEIISLLLSPDLRPGLRSWYRRHAGKDTNIGFVELRDRLSELTGETFV